MKKLINKLNPSNLSLKFQFVLSYLFITSLILTLCGVMSYNTILSEFRAMKEDFTIGSFQQFENNVNSLIDETNRFSRVVSSNIDIQKYMNDDITDELDAINTFNSISKYISNVLGNYEFIDSVFFSNEKEILGFSLNRSWRQLNHITSPGNTEYEVFNNAREKFPQICWSGGIKVLDFSMIGYDMYSSEKNVSFITATKAFKSISKKSKNWMMVINIPEKQFSSMYKTIMRTNEEVVQIIDEFGKVISGGISKKYGEMSKYSYLINTQSSYGSMVIKDQTRKTQLIYYKMQSTGWVVIHEIPMSQYNSNMKVLANTLIITFLISILAMVLIYYLWIAKITSPFKKLMFAMKEFGDGKLDIQINSNYGNEIGALIKQFNGMSEDIRKNIAFNKIIQEEKYHMEMRILQSQINPHFIYNTLNMIRWMAVMVKASNIVDVVVVFNKLLRPVFSSNRVTWSIKEEIEYIENYIYIVNKRFGEGIYLEFDSDDSALQYMVLRFIMQPIVENSVVHGFLPYSKAGIIEISSKITDGLMNIAFKDNGGGITEQNLEKIRRSLNTEENLGKDDDNIGLNNVYRRLKLHFGNESKIIIESLEGIGTQVVLIFPLIF